MSDVSRVLRDGEITGRGASLNPFVVVGDATGFIDFMVEVFGAEEVSEARTTTPDGLLIHAEIRIGDSLLLLADPQDGWKPRPGLFQLWVSDLEGIIDRAVSRGSTVVTPPTPFYGSINLARVVDPWENLWWLFQPASGQADPKPVWEGGSDTVFRTIDEYMRGHAQQR